MSLNIDYAINNALLNICRRVNKECEQVARGNLGEITEILQRNYQQVKLVIPGISFVQFKYTLAQVNGRVIERD